MAESIVIVCDDCGKPATATVTMKVVGNGAGRPSSRVKDLCSKDLGEYLANSRKPTRGRRAAALSA